MLRFLSTLEGKVVSALLSKYWAGCHKNTPWRGLPELDWSTVLPSLRAEKAVKSWSKCTNSIGDFDQKITWTHISRAMKASLELRSSPFMPTKYSLLKGLLLSLNHVVREAWDLSALLAHCLNEILSFSPATRTAPYGMLQVACSYNFTFLSWIGPNDSHG